jgi:hypothetical protein
MTFTEAMSRYVLSVMPHQDVPMMASDDKRTIPHIRRVAFTVEETFWTLLAYQHDGLADESETAQLQHLDAARWF